MNTNDIPLGRRSFLKGLGAAAAGWFLRNPLLATAGEVATPQPTPTAGGVPRRKLGRTAEMISIIGVGGHTLATASSESDSIRIAHEAIDQGINFMDNAWDYHQGRAEEVMGKALKGRRDKVFLMTKMCTHGKGKDVGMRNLEESLRRLQTDHLDLWMIHEITTQQQVDAAFAPGGSVEALEEAKKQGKIRYVGFTGHTDPNLHLGMLKHDYAFDAVLVPINAFDAYRGAGFRTEVLPELNRRNIAPLAFKSLGGNARVVRDGRITAEKAIRFALSQPVATVIVGMNSSENLRENLTVAQNFKPMSPDEQKAVMAQFASPEDTARYCLYHGPSYHDGDSVTA